MAVEIVEKKAWKKSDGYYEGEVTIMDTNTGEIYTGSCCERGGKALHPTREAAINCALREANYKRKKS